MSLLTVVPFIRSSCCCQTYSCRLLAVERNSVRLMKLSKLHMQEGIVQVGGQNPRTTATGAFLRKDSKKPYSHFHKLCEVEDTVIVFTRQTKIGRINITT
ncbi:unnamed protein product [Citrullus colocynthis]|uniref:Uncharacterized protein n=1 Tax=Citrullus colocynthis TaxID=252529 RepID=A0ABP0XQU2_9ROSI